MELVLKRIAKEKDYTIGRLYIRTESKEKTEETEYLCDTLEPTWRDYARGAYKVKGKSTIPEGRYAVVITYSTKFKKWLPLLLGVNNFSGIRIHAGNSANDTHGCILVGENLRKGMLFNSNICLKMVKERIVEAKDEGESVWIEIR